MNQYNFNSQMSSLSHQADASLTTRKVLDPIHNFIVFEKEIWQYIDTLEFQRLREIKQLGTSYLVFQGANHSRFEHSLGTAYLARKQMRSILKHQKAFFDGWEDQERVTRNVQLGGLCHDLGHGPLSHMFDNTFLPMVAPGTTWKHEEGSQMMLQKMVDDNNIDIDAEDLSMTKDIINSDRTKQMKYERTWIFDIVANKRNSIDVDKFDYMTRDSYHLGLKDTYFDYRNLIRECRVIDDELCFPTKLVNKVYELFQARYKLYKSIYQNRCTQALDHMFCDVLLNANHVFKFHEMIEDPEKFLGLTDYIFKEIEISKDPSLQKSQGILKQLKHRELYRFAAETLVATDSVVPSDQAMKEKIVSSYSQGSLTMDDVYISSGTVNFAFKDKNPVDSVRFFNRNNLTASFNIEKEKVSLLLPSKFSERYIRVFASSREKVTEVKKAFRMFCKENLHAETGPVEGEYDMISTPISFKNSIRRVGVVTNMPANSNSSFGDVIKKKQKKGTIIDWNESLENTQ